MSGNDRRIRVGILGASGYAGAELANFEAPILASPLVLDYHVVPSVSDYRPCAGAG